MAREEDGDVSQGLESQVSSEEVTCTPFPLPPAVQTGLSQISLDSPLPALLLPPSPPPSSLISSLPLGVRQLGSQASPTPLSPCQPTDVSLVG